ncbi:TIGR02270 family protein [Pyxidicoccus sp. 3LG]
MGAIPDILEEHLDEASFHWGRWERALLSPTHDLEETAEQEERLLAHLDGLAEAGPAAGPLLLDALDSGEAPRISAATFALLAARKDGIDEVLGRLRTGPAEARPALARALELVDRQGLDARLVSLLDTASPEVMALVLETLMARDAVPEAQVARLLTHESPAVRRAALDASTVLPARTVTPELLVPSLASANAGVRAAAIEAGLVRGMRTALAACREQTGANGIEALEAMSLLALGGSESDVELLVNATQVPARRSGALWALGFSGRPLAAETCLRWMEDDAVAAMAGEAFSAITGLKLAGPYALPPREEREEPIPLEEEALDADLVPRPEDGLPRPEAQAIRDWWTQHRVHFHPGTRYLDGQPLDAEALLNALERGPMRRRHLLARELALRSRGTLRVRTRVLCQRQRAELTRARSARTNLLMMPIHRMVG